MKKTILSLTPASKQLWSKQTREKNNASYILIAELPEQASLFYAGNISSDLGKHFGANSHQKIQEIAIKGKKSKESLCLELKLVDSDSIKLYNENFILLISCVDFDETQKEHMHNLFYFRMPNIINSPVIKQCYFPDDLKEQAATSLFLLASAYIIQGEE